MKAWEEGVAIDAATAGALGLGRLNSVTGAGDPAAQEGFCLKTGAGSGALVETMALALPRSSWCYAYDGVRRRRYGEV